MAKFKIQGVSVVAKGYKHQMLHASCGGGGGGGGSESSSSGNVLNLDLLLCISTNTTQILLLFNEKNLADPKFVFCSTCF